MPLEDLETRRGTAADYPEFEELFRAIAPDDPVPDRDRWEGFLAEQSLMVVHDGRVIAFANTELFPDRAHIHLLAVLPEYRRRSVARFLLGAVRSELRRAKLTRFSLHVREGNHVAIRLYESLGMRQVGGSVGLSVPWARVHELGPQQKADIRAELLPPEADSAMELTFSLTPTRLARFRERGRVVLGLFSGIETLGIAVHDPSSGSASSFRLKQPDLAPSVLLALAAHAEPDRDFIELSLEDDPRAEAVLIALGASVLYRSFRYEGVP